MGFLIATNKRAVSVAMNKGPSSYGEVMTIPRVCITSIKGLK
jgi:hypothetical protein